MPARPRLVYKIASLIDKIYRSHPLDSVFVAQSRLGKRGLFRYKYYVDRYEFKCPHCRAVLRVPHAAAGLTGKCGSCQESVTAPAAPKPAIVTEAATSTPARKNDTRLQNKGQVAAERKFRRRFTPAPTTKVAVYPDLPVKTRPPATFTTLYADIDPAVVKAQKFEIPEDVSQKKYLQRDHALPSEEARKKRSYQALIITIGLITAAISLFLYSLGWRLK
jgi:predicted Zn finger-like uncharacterized protein